jgi:hypothetical protein
MIFSNFLDTLQPENSSQKPDKNPNLMELLQKFRNPPTLSTSKPTQSRNV